ncbi:5-(carboxyamino)imidazole ribonucleotide synthase [Aestuariirhabdus litorea]|uniref:N5-carboxyaminoimidazole ribonucleotide synthase n=1 Tax=Aestuariirhabdus litorea TaxID=2528527 RepID=A0A3P3VQI6_9GAMM|nr:5-(carboxyamino)imidazole ribonucleotide synthase [Aestuariirhabdus litorea]RRJ84724.1 5-(carboxyamino)imidazole ribonucleotide synthase [Aestuariirhabdus litorea]RWW97949.1 5-(carboxyamino)imidazole ribonucleotide synthase [Endozoicomonadaceae bacterium GTF-13]
MMRIAIVGCGQLARMMALAGWPMGVHFTFLANPEENIDCVAGLGEVVRLTEGLSGESLYQALGRPEVVTVEREQVDTALLASLRPFCPLYPDPDAISICQHRGREKAFLQSLGIPLAPYRLANSAESLTAAVTELGYPVFVKSCEQGYDGQNQWRLRTPDELNDLIACIHSWPPLVVEANVEFNRELSIIAVRSASGDVACYPLTENHHREGILITSQAPAPELTPALQEQASELAHRLLTHWKYVGVLAIECFQVDDQLLVNELAPRVHNSGHWTQGAGICSQFENHLRAICDQGLGATTPLVHAAMVNLLGQPVPKQITRCGDYQVHTYNKQIKPRRKVGHFNFQDIDPHRLRLRLLALETELYPQDQRLLNLG